ncbi:fimbria/pilus outer membrane usher protein, partial [Streptococcus agalactiae]|uniref:fimbria/pilus outer membrane usher protein n=1 Tax=Streptococcus agalactiae TaxID=1311 RepID=UPI001C6108BB
ATGARVGNISGLSINKQGYAVIPYVTPYRLNDISLDPQGMPSTVELTETSHRFIWPRPSTDHGIGICASKRLVLESAISLV